MFKKTASQINGSTCFILKEAASISIAAEIKNTQLARL